MKLHDRAIQLRLRPSREFQHRRRLHLHCRGKRVLRLGRAVMVWPVQLEVRHLALDHPRVRPAAARGQSLGRTILQHPFVQCQLLLRDLSWLPTSSRVSRVLCVSPEDLNAGSMTPPAAAEGATVRGDVAMH